jgi:DNA-binding NarL/FixJ family response regulator
MQNAILLAWTGKLEQAHTEMLSIRQRCIEYGEENDLVFVAFHSVLLEIWRGNFTGAGVIAEDAIERALQLGGEIALFVAFTIRATLAAYAGRADEARRDALEAIAASQRGGANLLAEWPTATLGFLEVSLGNYRAALSALEPLLTALDATPRGSESNTIWFVPDAVEALIQLGRLADAEPLVGRLERNGRRLHWEWMVAVSARCRAMLLAAHGDLEAADAVAQEAMAAHDRLPIPFDRARTQLLLGQLQRRQRHKGVAAATLREALATFEDLDTPLWAERTRAELARTTRDLTAKLTPTEQRVADLAASGMTNRDIATALFISPKTVEANLSHVYKKLDISSRTELAQHISEIAD